jgi:hypothetical protein
VGVLGLDDASKRRHAAESALCRKDSEHDPRAF